MDVDDAWAAGFLDGEGYFFVAKRTTGTTRAAISASQIVRDPLEKLARLYGGSIYEHPSYGRDTRQTCYRWTLHGAAAIRAMLPGLIPHMTTKRREAELLLMVANLIPEKHGRRPTDEEIAERERLGRELVALRAAK